MNLDPFRSLVRQDVTSSASYRRSETLVIRSALTTRFLVRVSLGEVGVGSEFASRRVYGKRRESFLLAFRFVAISREKSRSVVVHAGAGAQRKALSGLRDRRPSRVSYPNRQKALSSSLFVLPADRASAPSILKS